MEDVQKDIVARTTDLASQVSRKAEKLESVEWCVQNAKNGLVALLMLLGQNQYKSQKRHPSVSNCKIVLKVREGMERKPIGENARSLSNNECKDKAWTLVDSLAWRREIRAVIGNKASEESETHGIRVAEKKSRDF